MRERHWRFLVGLLALLGALAVWVLATRLFPYHSLNHDEGVYLQQAAMLLEGQFVLRPPIEDAFRPWFFVDAGETLYPKYAPVPAAMFALGELLGGYRLALVGIAVGIVALVAGVAREVFDRETGVLAAVFVLCSPLFLLDSSVFLPYAPTALLNLTFAYSYLHADRTHSRRWAALAGVAIGLAFFARPYTAVLFATPFVVHALWTLGTEGRMALARQAATASFGLAGVALALAYNATLTGSPWVFPYQAFAPLDGLGFGHRRILNHEVQYSPALAVRANATVVEAFLTDWVAGGPLGSALTALGALFVAHSRRWRPSAREAVLAGVFVSIVVGNVYFWGNFNILGVLEEPGDGLIAALGPYYHFDLLLPMATFAAVGARRGAHTVRAALERRLSTRAALAVTAVALVVCAGAFAGVTAADVDDRVERNAAVTDTYETAYEPFANGTPRDAVVLLPSTYGPWLNHPFQALRNDPGFDGRTLYALNDRPFAVADAFPNRTLYRYGYRGVWAPTEGSPTAAHLQRVRDVTGSAVELNATVGIPDGAVGVTARVATDDGGAYYVTQNASDELALALSVADGRVRLDGDVAPVGNASLGVDGRDVVRLTVFVDYGPSGGFAYRFDLPVNATADGVRALSPRVEQCRNARTCGGAATYVPSAASDGVFVHSRLVARERNV
ncbi:ArnT family glycosyltransferase [Halarchaeum salinum]|uniref:Glycosyltransferase family 39 protein n=1 Tax=Halarchaeum salinum TaxID=489912 RepID=A0AAV3S263_9EURY